MNLINKYKIIYSRQWLFNKNKNNISIVDIGKILDNCNPEVLFHAYWHKNEIALLYLYSYIKEKDIV